MAKQKETQEERMVYVTIRPPRGRATRFEAWKYYPILNELRSCGATLNESHETAKWARKAKLGEKRTIWPEISMEVTAG